MTIYQVITFILLIIFYLSYFYKMYGQKKKGIKTDQLGKGKKDISTNKLEKILKLLTYTIVVIEIISVVLDTHELSTKYLLPYGIVILAFGVIIFIVAIITMSDSWRAGIPDNHDTKIVTYGIYKFSRNPAFLGFDLMYVGIVMAYFNIILLIFTLITIIVLHMQILNEEKFLEKEFCEEYLSYKSKVGRYFIV